MSWRRERLCDSLGDPYPDPFQAAFQSSRTAALADSECRLGMLPGIHQNPPTLSAAAWQAQVRRWCANTCRHLRCSRAA
jgi:hypothetical protein